MVKSGIPQLFSLTPEQPNGKRLWLIIGGALLVLALGFAAFWFFGRDPAIIGVQVITNKGTVVVGRTKYGQKLNTWVSPYMGYFDSRGNSTFFEITKNQKKAAQDKWEISWEWDELRKVGQKSPLIAFSPTREQISESEQNLSSICGNDSEEALSCQWSLTSKLYLEGVNDQLLCVSDVSNEFYGGAHPIALRRYGTYDLKTKTFLRLEDLIPEAADQNVIWKDLYQVIKNTDESSLSEDGGDFDVPDKKESNSSAETPKEQLSSLVSSRGYAFNPNVFCIITRPDGIAISFGFPHSEQIYRGLNLKSEALLSKDIIDKNKKLKSLFADYKYSFSDAMLSAYLTSPDNAWKISHKNNLINVSNGKDKRIRLMLPENAEGEIAEILGVVWIYKSPNLEELKKYKFNEVNPPSGSEKVDLNTYLK